MTGKQGAAEQIPTNASRCGAGVSRESGDFSGLAGVAPIAPGGYVYIQAKPMMMSANIQQNAISIAVSSAIWLT